MADKIEGYRKRDESYTSSTPKEVSKEMPISPPSEGSSMSTFRKSMEDHMNDINIGRGNGIPNNYQEKKVK